MTHINHTLNLAAHLLIAHHKLYIYIYISCCKMGKFSLALLSTFAAINTVVSTDYPVPNPTYEATQYTTWSDQTVGKSRKAKVYVPFTASDGSQDMISIYRLDLVGTDYERGYAHGYLLAKGWCELVIHHIFIVLLFIISNHHNFVILEIAEFQGPQLDKYFMQMVLDIDISSYPEPLQAILRVIQVKGALAAPEAFRKAMSWVWETEKSFVPQYIIDEMNGMAVGMCDSLRTPGCNSTEWATTISQLNMLPELIRMACTAYGAWGKATGGNGLIQMRALDFGGGPFANYTVAAVYRDAAPTDDSNAFVSITFPGFAGVITGVSQRGIGVSEKVWMTYDTPSLQPGSYNGEADVFVLRDILQLSKNRYLYSNSILFLLFVRHCDYD